MKPLKNVKKEVSNDTYNMAFLNQDNQRIISSVLAKYRGRLDEDVLTSCGLSALWRCLQNHNEAYTTKLTSSLWRFVHWECKKELQALARIKNKPGELFDIAIEDTTFTIFDDIHSFLDEEHCKIVELRFVDGLTLKEIGQKFGVSKEAARQKLDKALTKIKQVVYNEVEG